MFQGSRNQSRFVLMFALFLFLVWLFTGVANAEPNPEPVTPDGSYLPQNPPLSPPNQNMPPSESPSPMPSGGPAGTAPLPVVRIMMINGQRVSPPLAPLKVRPGDVVTLSADLIKFGEGCLEAQGCPANREIEEFSWVADDRAEDRCQPREDKDCLKHSSFQLNDYGISFYVPYNLGPSIKITAMHSDSATTDTLVLENANPPPAPQPLTITTSPTSYSYPVYQHDYALVGMGRWVFIGGARYWVPYTYRQDWVPYQNGYWSWVAGTGWTWVSYDPWGWVTDHYGIWRHHRTYGWIWCPFDRPVYRPAVVTWVFHNGYVGWYPYYSGYPSGYRFGVSVGFNDGFWAGFRVGGLSVAAAGYTTGFTVVKNEHFIHKNIYEVRLAETEAHSVWKAGVAARTFSEQPGRLSGEHSRIWMEKRIGGHVPVTITKEVTVGGTRLTHVEPVHPLPPTYQKVFAKPEMKSNIPVGSVVIHSEPAPRVIPPISNGRSLNHPFEMGTKPPPPPLRTKTPSLPHEEHPYATRVKMPPIQRAPEPKAAHPEGGWLKHGNRRK